MVYQEIISIKTSGARDIHDITDQVIAAVKSSGVVMGTAHVFNIGSTAVIGTIEYEPGLQRDISDMLNRIIPPDRNYGHESAWHDGNGHSHLQATLMGPSETLPVMNGKLALGVWQQIFHLECDIKPRDREIVVTITGEAKE